MSTSAYTSDSTNKYNLYIDSDDKKINTRCYKCGNNLIIPYIFRFKESDKYCIDCDPSTSEKKYKWNIEKKRWYIDHYIYQCTECDNEFKSYIRLNYDEIMNSCKHCYPDGVDEYKYEYKWDENYKCWDLDYKIVECKFCEKELRVKNLYPMLRINLDDYYYDEYREIAHGYNCGSKSSSSSESEDIYFQEVVMKDGKNRYKAYIRI